MAITRNHGWSVAARSEAKTAATFLPAELSRLALQIGNRSGADVQSWVGRLHIQRNTQSSTRFIDRAADEIPDPIGETLPYFRDIADRLERELAPAAASIQA